MELLLLAWVVSLVLGTLGRPLVQRKLTLLGDVLSHTVFLGVILAYVVSGARNPLWELVGAVAASFLSVALFGWLNRLRVFSRDAAMAITLSGLLGVALIFVAQVGSRVDLDMDCLLFGDFELLALERAWEFLGVRWPQSLIVWLGLLIVLLAKRILCYRTEMHSLIDGQDFALRNPLVRQWLNAFDLAILGVALIMGLRSVGVVMTLGLLVVPQVFLSRVSGSWKRQEVWLVFASLFASFGAFVVSRWSNVPLPPVLIVLWCAMTVVAILYAIKTPKVGADRPL